MSEALLEAIEHHNLNRLSSLLSHGADANVFQIQQPGWCPLHVAIDELENGGSTQALILLLRYGASVNEWTAGHGATPLLMALFRDQPEAARILLAAGADPNVVGDEGDSPLCLCVEQNDQEMVALLLRCGADKTINQAGAGPMGMNALGFAAYRLNLPMIKMLLAAGADPAVAVDYRTAQQCLPPRDTAHPHAWDEAMVLLDH